MRLGNCSHHTRHSTDSCSVTVLSATATAMAGCSSPRRQANAPAAAIAPAAHMHCNALISRNSSQDACENLCAEDNTHARTYRSRRNAQHEHMMTLCAPIKYNAMKSFTDHICSPAAWARRTYRQPCKSSGHIPRVLLRVTACRGLRKAPARQTQLKRQGDDPQPHA
jgi:hypothetical protein